MDGNELGIPAVKDVYTIDDVKDRWGCCRRTVAREIERGRLRAFHVGRNVRISRAAIEAYENGKVR